MKFKVLRIPKIEIPGGRVKKLTIVLKVSQDLKENHMLQPFSSNMSSGAGMNT